ncbi:MAG: hypothetical protein JWO77_1396 [Ilumatobacteraceae bacterium]|nr:hypothetical protein [Ilumatobacteraceae bacterium]
MDTETEIITADSPRSVRRAIMLQDWNDLASIHWRYDPADVQALLPDGFRADTFDGSAWVGVLPFHMRRVRFPHLPAFGPLSTFPETNVRTYLIDPAGRRAVWFCSLDITRLITALVARASYRLPYCWAKMSIDRSGGDDRPVRPGDTVAYRSRRRWPVADAETDIAVRVGEAIAPSEVSQLEHFLSARWALGTAFGKRLMWADVDHPPWPLHRAELLHLDQTVITAAGLPAPEGDPYVLWSPGIDVRIALPSRVRL